jgi:hypothetical protein
MEKSGPDGFYYESTMTYGNTIGFTDNKKPAHTMRKRVKTQ